MMTRSLHRELKTMKKKYQLYLASITFFPARNMQTLVDQIQCQNTVK